MRPDLHVTSRSASGAVSRRQYPARIVLAPRQRGTHRSRSRSGPRRPRHARLSMPAQAPPPPAACLVEARLRGAAGPEPDCGRTWRAPPARRAARGGSTACADPGRARRTVRSLKASGPPDRSPRPRSIAARTRAGSSQRRHGRPGRVRSAYLGGVPRRAELLEPTRRSRCTCGSWAAGRRPDGQSSTTAYAAANSEHPTARALYCRFAVPEIYGKNPFTFTWIEVMMKWTWSPPLSITKEYSSAGTPGMLRLALPMPLDFSS